MAANVEALGIDRLTVAERLELIEQIWDSLPEQVEASDVAPWRLGTWPNWPGGERRPKRGLAWGNPGARCSIGLRTSRDASFRWRDVMARSVMPPACPVVCDVGC
jgi:hypothetical protein